MSAIGNKTELIVEASIRANDRDAVARSEIFIGLAERAINDLFIGFPGEVELQGSKAALPDHYRSAVRLVSGGQELALVEHGKELPSVWCYSIWMGHIHMPKGDEIYAFSYRKEIEPLGDGCPTEFLLKYPEIYLTAVTSQILKGKNGKMDYDRAGILDSHLHSLIANANRMIGIGENMGKEEMLLNPY